MDRLATVGYGCFKNCHVSCQNAISKHSPTPFLLCHTIPTNKAFLLGTSLLFFPYCPLSRRSSHTLSFSDAREERKRALKHSTHTSSIQKQNSPNSATSKVIDALHLRAKVAAAQVQKLQQPSPEISFHICKQASKQASKQARRWDREVPDILELIAHYPDWVSPPHLQCEFVCLFVCLFVCFFFFP